MQLGWHGLQSVFGNTLITMLIKLHPLSARSDCANGMPSYYWPVIFRKLFLGLLIIVLLLAGLMMLVGTQPSATAGPSGSILVSSATDAYQVLLTTYAMKADGSGHTIVGSDPASSGDRYSVSRDGTTVAFVGTTALRLQQLAQKQLLAGQVLQVYRGTVSGGVIPSPAAAQQITNSAAPLKMLPSVSDDGALVAYASASSTERSVASSTIHLIANGTDTALFAGTQPVWFSKTAFYYLAPDGVRLYDTAGTTSTVVLPILGQSNEKLALSPDRGTFAFVVPDAGSVYFFRISAGGAVLSPLKTLQLTGFWALFSPDSRYAAIQTADADGSHPSIVIIDTVDFSQVSTIDLGPLLNAHLFMTAWTR